MRLDPILSIMDEPVDPTALLFGDTPAAGLLLKPRLSTFLLFHWKCNMFA